MRRPRRGALLSLSLAALLAPACGDDPAPPPAETPAGEPAGPPPGLPPSPELEAALAVYDGRARPDANVLLISLDSVRADYLSCYGHRPRHAPEEKTTPHIDRLAADGVLFEEYRSNTSWTLPSHISMMTGQPDLVHAVDFQAFALDPRHPTLALVLQRLGYATAGFYSGPYVHERFGFGRGFDRYEACYGPEMMQGHRERARLQQRIERAVREGRHARADQLIAEQARKDTGLNRLSHADRSSRFVTDHALEAIETAEAEGRPWFVFAHYFDPHYDYVPPGEYATRFDPDYRGEIDGVRFFRNPEIGTITKNPNVGLRDRVISERDLDHVKALYEGEIAWTDAQIGRLLDSLRQRGVLDSTLVLVTSDHGEEFFEHGGIGHRHSMLEEQLHVPLVLRLPGALPAGARVRGLGSHADLLPTVLDLLGLPAPGGLRSRSLRGLIDGSDEGGDRHVLGRLVEYYPFSSVGGGPVARNQIREVFLSGTLKLTRIVRWPEPLEGCPPERAARLEAYAEEARTRDFELRWIDLAATPGERPGDFHRDFADPRAAASLERFRELYSELTAVPRPVLPAVGDRVIGWLAARPGFARMVTNRRAKYLLAPPGR